MGTEAKITAPRDLGIGRVIDRSITLDAVLELWPCPTEREDVPPIPGDPGRVVLVYSFPQARLEARVADAAASQGYEIVRLDVIRLHFTKQGTIIFMEQGLKGNLEIALGGDVLSFTILPGEGHYSAADCDCR